MIEYKVYEATLDGDQTGVDLISFVESPAISTNFVALSEQKEVKLNLDKLKRWVTGPALIPDQLIMRKDGDQVFFIKYNKIIIEEVVKQFFKLNKIHNTNLEHEILLDKNFIIESWIIQDSNLDKSRVLGFDLPVGTWMVTYFVEDEKFFNEVILTQKVKGFSIEGFFQLNEISKFEIKNKKIKNSMIKGLVKRYKLNLSIFTLEDGSMIEIDDETMDVFSLLEDGSRGDVLADGVYNLDDGSTLEVVDGKMKMPEEQTEISQQGEMFTLEDGSMVMVLENLQVWILDENGEPVSTLGDGVYKLADGSEMVIQDGLFLGVNPASTAVLNQSIVMLEKEQKILKKDLLSRYNEIVVQNERLSSKMKKMKEELSAYKTLAEDFSSFKQFVETELSSLKNSPAVESVKQTILNEKFNDKFEKIISLKNQIKNKNK